MTREEAIEQLQDAKDGYKEYLSNDALDIAISALEHPERNVVAIVPCGDCISRADAIKAMQNKAKKLKNEDTINGLCGAVAILYEMPSVTPQEPILDKIRAEIESKRKMYLDMNDIDWLNGCDYVLSVLDKYKAEKEE